MHLHFTDFVVSTNYILSGSSKELRGLRVLALPMRMLLRFASPSDHYKGMSHRQMKEYDQIDAEIHVHVTG